MTSPEMIGQQFLANQGFGTHGYHSASSEHRDAILKGGLTPHDPMASLKDPHRPKAVYFTGDDERAWFHGTGIDIWKFPLKGLSLGEHPVHNIKYTHDSVPADKLTLMHAHWFHPEQLHEGPQEHCEECNTYFPGKEYA